MTIYLRRGILLCFVFWIPFSFAVNSKSRVSEYRQKQYDLVAMKKGAREVLSRYTSLNKLSLDAPIGEGFDFISDYETQLPHTDSPEISMFENRILSAYLDNPDNRDLSRLMAVYHILRSGLYRSSPGGDEIQSVDRLKSTIYAQYFLYRTQNLGVSSGWVGRAIEATNVRLATWLPLGDSLDFSEGSFPQEYFFESFTLNEPGRYDADSLLLQEVLEKPANLLTNFYVSGVNLWNAGEAEYDDATVLYAYIVCSYFGERIELLARRAQNEWLENQPDSQLFRLVTSIGGFTLPARRWFAKLHKDQQALTLVDAEMEEWLAIYPEFYAFPVAVIPFVEPDNFFSGLNAYFAGITRCTEDPSRVCGDTPRSPFNVISFLLLGLDYLLKVGDIQTASEFLAFKYDPSMKFDYWTMGQEVWNHREENFYEIAARYQNDDPSDDPVNAFIKTQKWGVSSTCQFCHQNQGFFVSDEDRRNIPARLSEDRLFLDPWPDNTVTWYGDVIE